MFYKTLSILIKIMPKALIFMLMAFLSFFFINFFYRFIFLSLFIPDDIVLFSNKILYAFYLGIRYDLRLSALIIALPFVLSVFTGEKLIHNNIIRNILSCYFILCFILILIFFGIDISAYSYIRNRANPALLMFLDNPDISFTMIYQSYPVIPIFIGLLALLFLFYSIVRYILNIIKDIPSKKINQKRILINYFSMGMLIILFLYGSLSSRPLSGRDAYWTKDGFISSFSFNPLLYFYKSAVADQPSYTEQERVKAYEIIAEFLRIDKYSNEGLSLERQVIPESRLEKDPNIVVIMLETFASFKVGAMGNELGPSPHFDRLAKEGLLFKNFFVPFENTSRSIFSTFFGIPDIGPGRYAHLEPLFSQKFNILNQIEDYEKLYFIGGCASWGDIRGFLAFIDNMKLYEQDHYESPVHDVWGISDADLFYESNKKLRNKREPFFAYIQTAGNHRPFKIPEDNKGFVKRDLDLQILKEHGFYSLKEFNGFRFLDHSLGYYFQIAENEDYFENTIFIIYGDHGTQGGAIDRRFGDLALASYHVPMLIYAPGFFKESKEIYEIASVLDLMPTIAGIIGRPYINHGLGRDIFDEDDEQPSIAWTYTLFRNPPRFGLFMDEFYILSNTENNHNLYKFDIDADYKCLKDIYPEKASYMHKLNEAVFIYSQYIFYHYD